MPKHPSALRARWLQKCCDERAHITNRGLVDDVRVFRLPGEQGCLRVVFSRCESERWPATGLLPSELRTARKATLRNPVLRTVHPCPLSATGTTDFGSNTLTSSDLANSPYADPIHVDDLSDCYYYHTMDVPGHGLVPGQWDLRGRLGSYLGGVSVKGQRVFEVGTASGYVCFEMEAQGAEVVAYDLSKDYSWDIVPFSGNDVPGYVAQRREQIGQLNNSWWFNHAAFGSKARVVYGTVYDIPVTIGPVDLCVLGAVLLHVRDPFLALQQALKLGPRKVIVVEPFPAFSLRSAVTERRWRRTCTFVPDAKTRQPVETWWSFTPRSLQNMLGILGYETVKIVKHTQHFYGRPTSMFTIVAERLR